MRDDAPLFQDQRFYRLLFENAADAVVITDDAGIVLQVNHRARELNLEEVLSSEQGDDAEQSLSAFHGTLAAAGCATLDIRIGRGCKLRSLNVEGQRHDGHHVLVVRDVTDRRRLEDEVRHLRRAESVGYLTASVVHDFNNMLTPIVCASSMLMTELPRESQALALASDIRAAAERAAGLVRQVLAFVRRETVPPQRVQVGAVVDELRSLLARVVGEEVEVEVEHGEKLGDAIVDREQLEQVLLNLAANARDAMPRGGKISVRTANVNLDDGEANEHECPAGGAYVVLSVTDTGGGMSPEVRERIFERFYTTKEVGHGTGLGLAGARRFVMQSGGCISVHSEPGLGTTVAVYLPRASPAVASVKEARKPSSVPASARGTETILVVEDDDHVRRVVRAVLEEEGYGVLDAPSGDLALRYVERHEGPIDLVLTDVVMPGMSGQVFVEKLREDGYVAKVLFMSGHTDRAIDAHGVDGAQAIIRKAFTPAALTRKVREVLDATG